MFVLICVAKILIRRNARNEEYERGQNTLINYMVPPNTRKKFHENSPCGSRCDTRGRT